MRKLAGVILLTLLGFGKISSLACIWDRDTLAKEAKGLPDAIAVIAGRFDRFPPRYYEMRLSRVKAEIESAPNRLDLYDDAGAACDRLHRGDEAVAWMEKKRTVLDAVPESPETNDHLYRYHANLGTFLAHRWLRAGAPTERVSEIEQARNEIAKAIEINPDAHFGREKYQLMAIEWIIQQQVNPISKPVSGDWSYQKIYRSFLPLKNLDISTRNQEKLADIGLENATEGLTGLIVLGDAWESVDVFYSLQLVFEVEGHASIAELAKLRRNELEAAGKNSLFRGSDDEFPFREPGAVQATDHISEYFQSIREEAKQWHQARLDYQNSQFDAGRHPDTDPDFWKGFSYNGEMPKPPSDWSRLTESWYLPELILILCVGAFAGIVGVIIIRKIRAFTRLRLSPP